MATETNDEAAAKDQDEAKTDKKAEKAKAKLDKARARLDEAKAEAKEAAEDDKAKAKADRKVEQAKAEVEQAKAEVEQAGKAKQSRRKSGPRRTTPLMFYRQVVGELRKVIWPTRNELVTYTIVALIFVLIMVAIVSGLDWVFAWATVKFFG